jgi:hypothetical protein
MVFLSIPTLIVAINFMQFAFFRASSPENFQLSLFPLNLVPEGFTASPAVHAWRFSFILPKGYLQVMPLARL